MLLVHLPRTTELHWICPPCLQRLLHYIDSIPPSHSSTLHRCAERTGSSHKAEQVLLHPNRPFTAMELIGWISMHEDQVPQSRPYHNPVTATSLPHDHFLGLENGEHSVLRQRMICLVRLLFSSHCGEHGDGINERVKAFPGH